jgi:phosphoglycolate phosphatase
MYQNIIFDLDGTLIHSAPSILKCFQDVTGHLGYSVKVPLHEGLIGPPLREALSIITGENDEEVLDKLAIKFMSIYDSEGYKQCLPYKKISDLLHALVQDGVALYIVTNKRCIPTVQIVEHFGWEKCFKGIFAIDSYPDVAKNKAEILQRMLEDCGLDRAQTCYVGDTHKDYQATQINSLDFIFVQWGYGDAEGGAKYDRHAQQVSDLHRLLLSKT